MYNHRKIEIKWQNYWLKNKSFKTTNQSLKKYYVLDMFPYPSGSGLHVGHPKGYTATDIVARFKRLKNFDVLHPIGWDAFGLPAEQYALKTGNNPYHFTNQNINNFRSQLQKLGFSYDYDKEINTSDPKYYKWTQWIFAKLYENDLAVLKEVPVNWCQELGTVLANEEVIEIDGERVSERGHFPVIEKSMLQWVLKITKYADKLLDGLKEIDWPSSLKKLQTNWIGKKEDGTYNLRDWIFSRQRYWGEPFPIIFDEDGEIFLADSLPIILPQVDNIKVSGIGESPLFNIKEWVHFEKNNKKFRRETNTMPQWAGSSWYYLAYILKNEDGTYLPLDSNEAKRRFQKWLPVDLYIGGQEHAVLHLLYARFWHKFLYDLKIIPTSEPFLKVINQGMILGTDNFKMSKSRGNIVNPDQIIIDYGADALRLFEMFMGSLEDTAPWSNEGLKAIKKWLNRIYRLYQDFQNQKEFQENSKIISNYHKLIKTVEEDIENFKFNTVISKLMVFINSAYEFKKNLTNKMMKDFAILLSLFAPHLGEELLEMINEKPIRFQKFPKYEQNLIVNESIVIAVQINGKLRTTLLFENKIAKDDVILEAKKDLKIKNYIKEAIILKVIYIENKILNFVIKAK